MTGAPQPAGNRWADLGPRIASAVVMVAVGGAAVWFGGWALAVLMYVLLFVFAFSMAGAMV